MVIQQVNNDEIDLREYLGVLIRRWRVIALLVIIIPIVALLYSLTQSPVYEAKTTILIRSGGSISSLSQYAGLVGMLGINLSAGGAGNLGDLTELLKSQAVAAKVLDDLDLVHRIKGWDSSKLQRQQLVSAVGGFLKPTKTIGNVVEIKVEANDPQLAADIANGFINALSYYWAELNFTEAQNKLRYIETEIPRVERELKVVEGKLKLSPEGGGPNILGGGQGGIQRDYDIYNSVYTMLRKEYESNKLEASKEIPPFSVIDKAEKPLSKSKPKPKQNVMIGVVIGLFAGVFLAFFQEYWEKSSKS